MKTQYLAALRVIELAEQAAYTMKDYDTLARMYLPLQELHRQRRIRCAEGVMNLSLWAQSEQDVLDPQHVIENYPQSQLLVAGWASIEPARAVRRLAHEKDLYIETLLAAVYPIEGCRVIVIVPFETDQVPPPGKMTLDQLKAKLPAHSIVLPQEQLPQGPVKGSILTLAQVSQLWEQLHLPILAQAEHADAPLDRIDGYRRTIRVDYACELAHQKLSAEAHELARM